MRSIQEVGLEILNDTPASLYFFCGNEIGIKEKYIDTITSHYGDAIEVEKLTDVLKLMRTKHIIPLKPKLYIVRYDEEFISTLTDKVKHEIAETKIIGTIVGVYESSKHVAKLDKYLGNYSVSIDTVDPKFVTVYLHQDFPGIPDRFVDIAVRSSANYSQARNMCRAMNAADKGKLYAMSDSQIADIFGYTRLSTENQIKHGVAARNFKYLVDVIETFEGETDTIFYAILSTMIELEKCMTKKYTDSELKEYLKLWTAPDIYYMFMHTYQQLKKLRSSSVSDPKNLLMYLISLLPYRSIPSVEVLK